MPNRFRVALDGTGDAISRGPRLLNRGARILREVQVGEVEWQEEEGEGRKGGVSRLDEVEVEPRKAPPKPGVWPPI